jgi:hypothetical protein
MARNETAIGSERALAAGDYRGILLYASADLVGSIFAGDLYRWFGVQPCTLGRVTVPPGAADE